MWTRLCMMDITFVGAIGFHRWNFFFFWSFYIFVETIYIHTVQNMCNYVLLFMLEDSHLLHRIIKSLIIYALSCRIPLLKVEYRFDIEALNLCLCVFVQLL